MRGRVFSEPPAYWSAAQPPPQESPFAKGNADCRSFDFLQYREMVDGMRYLEDLFPRFIRFYRLEKAFGDGDDCATSTKRSDLCSAGLPRGAGRVKSDLWMIRVTDERVPNKRKKFFVFPLSIHGIERAGVEAGVRSTDDLSSWANC